MRINFECSGGYAKLQLTYNVDTKELNQEDAAKVHQMVADSGLADLSPEAVAPKSPGPPDVLSYHLSISDMGWSKTLTLTDVTAPPAMRPLLAHLVELAFSKRRTGSTTKI
jgi:hypothetical protein